MKDDMEGCIRAAQFAADLDDDDGPKNAAMLLKAWGRAKFAEQLALMIDAQVRLGAMSRACRHCALLLSDTLED